MEAVTKTIPLIINEIPTPRTILLKKLNRGIFKNPIKLMI
jgi:hypothetical protein